MIMNKREIKVAAIQMKNITAASKKTEDQAISKEKKDSKEELIYNRILDIYNKETADFIRKVTRSHEKTELT